MCMLCYGPINVKPHGGEGHGGGQLIDLSLLTLGNFILWWEYFEMKHTKLGMLWLCADWFLLSPSSQVTHTKFILFS